jgi:hypothetical protein
MITSHQNTPDNQALRQECLANRTMVTWSGYSMCDTARNDDAQADDH